MKIKKFVLGILLGITIISSTFSSVTFSEEFSNSEVMVSDSTNVESFSKNTDVVTHSDTDVAFSEISWEGFGNGTEIIIETTKLASDEFGSIVLRKSLQSAFISHDAGELTKPVPPSWQPKQIEKISNEVMDELSNGTERIKISILMNDTPELPSEFSKLSESEKSSIQQERIEQIELIQKNLIDFLNSQGATRLKPDKTINTIDVEIPANLISVLENREDILTIRKSTLDSPFFPAVDESRRLEGIESLWVDQIFGTGILVAVIDTGVNKDHPDLDDIDNNPSTNDPKITTANHVSVTGTSPYDCFEDNGDFGHGTTVAGIISGTGELNPFFKGFAPETSIMSVRVFDNSCVATTQSVKDGIQHVLDYNANPTNTQKVEVINISTTGQCLTPDGSDEVSLLVDQAYDAGIAVIAAVGNTNNCPLVTTPGTAHKGLAVGALNQNDLSVWDNSVGPTTDGRIKPEVTAVQNVTSLNTTAYYSDDSRIGTSITAPQVSGSIAVLEQLFEQDLGINLEPGRAFAMLLSSANGEATSGSFGLRMDNNIGAGMIDMSRNIETVSGFIELNDGDILNIPFNIPSDATRFSAALWWPESFSQTHNDMDLIVHQNPAPNEIASSKEIDSITERVIITNPNPGSHTMQIHAFEITAPDVKQKVFYAYSIETPDPCSPPEMGDWIISSSCTMSSSQLAPANVQVENNASLTIPKDLTLDIDFANHHLMIKAGSKVVIENGGRIT